MRHRLRLSRVAAALSCCVALLAAAACTDAGGTAPPTDGPPTTTSATTTAPSTSPAPTPEEAAEAAALDALTAYWDVSQAYRQAPAARDWQPELRRYADDAATAVDLGIVQRYLEGGIRREGEETIDPEVTSVDLAADPQPTVMVTACFDPTGAVTVDADTGEPTGLDPEPELPRWELRVTVLQYPEQEGSPWLVHVFEPLTDQPC